MFKLLDEFKNPRTTFYLTPKPFYSIALDAATWSSNSGTVSILHTVSTPPRAVVNEIIGLQHPINAEFNSWTVHEFSDDMPCQYGKAGAALVGIFFTLPHKLAAPRPYRGCVYGGI